MFKFWFVIFGHYCDPALILATMLLNLVKQSFADLPSTSSAMAIHRSLVGIEPGNYFMAASILLCCEFVHPSASTTSPLLASYCGVSATTAAFLGFAAAAGYFPFLARCP